MQRRALWLTVAKAVAGFVLGLAIWWGVSPSYGSAIAGGAEPLIRIFESRRVTHLRAENREVIVDRSDFPPASPRPGIPADDRERVLQRFVRLEKSRSRPGSGLGLSLVAAVARLHHGTI